MARPTKQGIDYFPVDVQFDDKVELYVAEKGAEGLGILITIWQIIYQNEGYFVKNDHNLVLLVRRRTMSEVEKIEDCISCAIFRGIFDERKAKHYRILTSKAIQKRYIVAARKKKEVSGVGNYLYKCIVDAGKEYGNLLLDSENATKEEEEEEEEEEVKEKVDVKKGKQNNPKFNTRSMKPEEVSGELWSAFLENRRFKKLQNSKIALTTIMNSFKKGIGSGYSYEQMITRYISSGMQRFNVEWMKDKPKNKRGGYVEPSGTKDYREGL